MAPQILPATETGVQVDVDFDRTQEDSALVRRFSGPKDAVRTEESTAWQSTSFQFLDLPGRTFEVVSSSRREARGRGALDVTYRQILTTAGTEGTQELYGVDVGRDIYSAPYFESMTNAQLMAVRTAFESQDADLIDPGWSTLQKRLFGHLAHGQEQYIETYYELRWTIKATSRRLLNIDVATVNTVQALPTLADAMTKLIGTLPAGEWLYKPVQVASIGRNGWQVVRTWQWAKKWSVIYGGTFTGEDA